MAEPHLIEIYRAANQIEAHLLKGELEAGGIRALVTDETTCTITYPGTWWASPRILVDEADAARAIALIAERGK
jgi:hypothetical protein